MSVATYLSVKPGLGDALSTREGSAGDLLLAALDGRGGAGAFVAGSVQKQSAAPGLQAPSGAKSEARKMLWSAPSRAGHPAGVPEPSCVTSGTLADGFSLVGKVSSSSNVTQPLGCAFSALRD